MEGVHNSEVLLPNTSFTHSISDSTDTLLGIGYIRINVLSIAGVNVHLKVFKAI